MIDLERAQKAFNEYVKPYDVNNERIALKIKHTARTVDVAGVIATQIGLNEEDIQLAKLIGLLHDIGRFEQVRIYNTFRDYESIDHADKGLEVLFKEKIIEKVIEDRQYDEIIRKAIKNHNKFEIDMQGLNERELLHAKLIRDADKTDILSRMAEDKVTVLYDFENLGKDELREETIKDIMDNKILKRHLLKDPIEHFVSNMCYVFDYNFKPGLQIVKEKKYIKKMINKIGGADEKQKEKLAKVEEAVEKYIDKRLLQ